MVHTCRIIFDAVRTYRKFYEERGIFASYAGIFICPFSTGLFVCGLVPRALTDGRPFQQLGNGETIKTTEMLALNIVNAFGTNGGGNRGVGQAKAVIFFIVVAAISIIQLQASRRKEVQQ